MIDQIIDIRSNGNENIKSTTKTKLILKGINVDNYNASSPDDPAIIQKLNDLAKDLGITL